MRRITVAVCLAVLMVGAVVPGTGAAAPKAVTITSVMDVTGTGTNTGTFEATGPAVTRHVICAAGSVTDTYLHEVDQGWEVGKAFVCEGRTATFLVRLVVHPNEDGTEWFSWTIQGGSGAYRGLFGGGQGTTSVLTPDNQVTNTYTGMLVGW